MASRKRKKAPKAPASGPAAEATKTCEASEASCEGDSCEAAGMYVPKSVEGGEGLTREIVGAFAALVRTGLRKTVAAAKLGIPVTTYQHWMREGATQIRLFVGGRRPELGLCGEFVIRVDKAEAEFHESLISIIVASGDADLAYKLLVKRFPKHYLHNGRKVIDDDTAEEETATDAETTAMVEARIAAMFKGDE